MRIKPCSLGPIHFVGLGGIGMSGIAEILHTLGYVVQGSDLTENANMKRLQGLGVKTFVGHAGHQVDGASVVVVSSAVNAQNPEVQGGRERGIPIIKRSEMLAELMRLKPSIAIAGTHGKTTTTSLVACVLDNAGLDPTVINGGIINAYGTNARLGSGEWLVAETDESDGSFTRLPLTMGIITNIEEDHMDFYKDFSEIQDAFEKFIANIPFYGMGVVCVDHPQVRALLSRFSDRRVLTYGFSKDAHIVVDHVRSQGFSQVFDVHVTAQAMEKIPLEPQRDFMIRDIFLPMVGTYNVLNAVGALVVGLELGIQPQILKTSFEKFTGVKRRFTKVSEVDTLTIMDDYAHHPSEVQVVLQAAQDCLSKPLVVVFQPHRYSRLGGLLEDFARSFQGVDHVIITPVYSAGEDPSCGVNHEVLAEKIREHFSFPVHVITGEEALLPLIQKKIPPGASLVFMGAGDISRWAYTLAQQLQESPFFSRESSQEGLRVISKEFSKKSPMPEDSYPEDSYQGPRHSCGGV